MRFCTLRLARVWFNGKKTGNSKGIFRGRGFVERGESVVGYNDDIKVLIFRFWIGMRRIRFVRGCLVRMGEKW